MLATFCSRLTALPQRTSALPRRGAAFASSSASSSGAGGKAAADNPGFLEGNRNRIVYVCFSGALFMMSIHLTNLRHKADDMEAELRNQLRAATLVRQTILLRAPLLAREAGLPAAKQEAFAASLQSLATEADADPAGVAAAAAASVAKPAPTAAPGASAPRAAAVW